MTLNLFFPSNENLILKTSPGSAPVHLLGYCEQRINPDEEDDLNEEDSELGDEDLMADEDEDEEEEEPVSSDSASSKRKAAPVNEVPTKRVKKAEPTTTPAPTPAQPKKAVPQEAPAKAAPAPAAAAPSTPPAAKKAEKKKAKDKEREKSASVPHLKEKTDNGMGVQKKLSLGVLSTLHQIGKGAKATAGKKVIYYLFLIQISTPICIMYTSLTHITGASAVPRHP